ncbi:MAG: ABC-2 family transporter protein [Chloroflexi bacterium]|nr:ABC-2 family transporter protein [Chloroflexota bacterium]
MQIIRSFWKTAAMEAASLVGEDSLFVVQYIFRFLRVVVLLAVWRTVLEGRTEVAGMTAAAVLTYTLIAEVFAEQLAPKTDVEWALHDGGIAMRFLQPLGLVVQFGGLMFGRWWLGLALFSLPLLLAAPLLGVDPRPASLAAGLLFVPSLVLAVVVGVALEFIFAALLVYMEGSAYIVARVRVAITLVLSGALIPLRLLPWGLGDVLQWLPFAAIASAPLQIFTGTGDPPLLIGLQLFWAVMLWAFSEWFWRTSRERLVSYGG